MHWLTGRFSRSLTPSFLFFGLLFVLVFLGDGKQAPVDIVASAGVLILFMVHRIRDARNNYDHSRPTRLLWGGFFVLLILLTIFSYNPGYSISSLLRYCLGYIVFAAFSSSREEKSVESFAGYLLLFGVFVVASSFFVTLFPSLGTRLPGMNLLYPNYGHNHIADIIVLFFPLVIHRLLLRQNWIHVTLFILVAVSVLLSFARGAMVLLFFYISYLFLVRSDIPKRIKVSLFILQAGFLTVFALLLFVPVFFVGRDILGRFVPKQLIKPQLLEQRLPYWEQAVDAIRQKPVFGFGPGTFYLISKRFQQAPNSYSWYAHSFPLQTLVEVGAIGFVLLGIIIWQYFYLVNTRSVSKSINSSFWSLRDGAVLTLIYSLFEVNLDFLVIWILWWATLGVLMSEVSFVQKDTRHQRQHVSTLTISLMGAFFLYATSMVSEVGMLVKKYNPLSFSLQLYNADFAAAFLHHTEENNISIPSWAQAVILFIHKNNPEVLYALVKVGEKKLLGDLVLLDPYNIEYHKQYVNYLLIHQQGEGAIYAISRVNSLFVSWRMNQATLSAPALIDAGKSMFAKFFELTPEITPRLYIAKTYYLIGLAVLNSDPKKTKDYWIAARFMSPEIGFFHHELASLMLFVFKDRPVALVILDECMKTPRAAAHCQQLLPDLKKLPPPGHIVNSIAQVRR